MRMWGVHQNGIPSTLGDWRRVVAWLGLLVLACGRPDDGQGPSLPNVARDQDEPAASDANDSSTGDDPTSDAGAPPPSGVYLDCPAPRPEAEPGVASGWARDPATGECCPYDNRNAAPNGWLPFESGIECLCSVESCPSTLEEAEQRLCPVTSPAADVVRFVGCGLVAVVDYSGYEEWTFEQSGDSATPAPRLVGATKYSNASSIDAGATPSWRAGVDPAHCDYDGESTVCQLCGGDPATDLPPCQ